MPDLSLLSTVNKWSRAHAPKWSSRAAVLSAYQCAEVIKTGSERFEEWAVDSLALDEVEVKVKLEVAERINAWVRLTEAPQDAQDREVIEVGLDWGARIIRMLVEEWEIRKGTGAAGYREQYEGGKLPWQKLMEETMCLYNKEVS